MRASYVVPAGDALWALLHDASEAYLGDMVRPLKYEAKFLEFYGPAERELMLAIYAKFGLEWPEPESVHRADQTLLRTEQRDLMPNPPAAWKKWLRGSPRALPDRIVPVGAVRAREMFLARYHHLEACRI